MYGYVSINRESLSEDELNSFRARYCGLCRTLKLRYGQAARFTLSYDMTVMYLLHSALYEPAQTEGRERCAAHIVKPHAYAVDECAEYAADMSVILAWYKAEDDWRDDRSLKKLALKKALTPAWEIVNAHWADKCAAIGEAVSENTRLERDGTPNPDAAANLTGTIMGHMYAWKDDIWRDTLYRMGHSLGRFIYLMDAYDDLEGDIKAHRPNPLIGMKTQKRFDEEIEDILTLEMADACAMFERLPIVRDASILRNIYYSGVWCRFVQKMAGKQEKGKGK